LPLINNGDRFNYTSIHPYLIKIPVTVVKELASDKFVAIPFFQYLGIFLEPLSSFPAT